MRYRLWQAALVVVSLMVLSVPTLYIIGIWTMEGRLAGIATVLLLTCFPVVPAFTIWTNDCEPYRDKPLPRADRKKLRDEQRRINLEKAIREAERVELG